MTDPVINVSGEPIAEPIPSAPLALLKPLTDWNGLWQQKTALIYQETGKNPFVKFGTISTLKNFKFDTSAVEVLFQKQTTCFDAVYLDS